MSRARDITSYRPQPCANPNATPPPPLVNPNTNIRLDNRTLDQFRPIYMTVGSVTQAAGSAYVEFDGTKVLCSVHEPSASSKDLREYSEVGVVKCDFKFAPFSSSGDRRELRQSSEEKDYSRMLENSIARSIRLELYPKSVINIHVLVIQSCGGVLAAAITCASIALAHAGIECYDMVAACSAVRLGDVLALDPSEVESVGGNANMTLAYMPNLDKITHVTQAGRLIGVQSTDSIDLCVGGCKTLFKMMKQCLLTDAEKK
jgi:exosome complex component MTR3